MDRLTHKAELGIAPALELDLFSSLHNGRLEFKAAQDHPWKLEDLRSFGKMAPVLEDGGEARVPSLGIFLAGLDLHTARKSRRLSEDLVGPHLAHPDREA